MVLRCPTSSSSAPRPILSGPRRRTDSAGQRQRGSVLIVALLISALIAMVLGSYLNLNLSSSRMAKRTFNGYAALNIAEAGTEEGVWSFNRAIAGDAAAWDGWEKQGTVAWKKFSDFELGRNLEAWVKVYVDNTTPSSSSRPKVIVQSSLGAPGDVPVTRMIEVTLRRRAFFAGGLVGKDSVSFSGSNASVDSWNSDPDNDVSTAPIPYSAGVRTDRGSVASTALVNTAVILNQAHVWGYVATGGGQPQVGSGGTIRGADTPTGVSVDANRVATDFSADLALVTAPVDGTPIVTLGANLGAVGTATKWRASSINLSGSESLTVRGQVTVVLTAGSGAPAITVTGNATINIPDGSSLTLYAEGDVKVGGKGVANSNVRPISCQIWGTNTSPSGQEIQIVGNGALKAVVYAPNGDVKINGNGEVMGSVVARNITLVGNAAFHYDESLANEGTVEPFSISKWRELTSDTDRARYEAIFGRF